jgi:polyhydroxyalkanoate synthesis regulator protein
MHKQEAVDEVLKLLSSFSIKDKVEVLANVFIVLGVPGIKTTDEITRSNIIDIVLRDIEKNGQTLTNALVRQGLLILTWLKED